MKEIITLGIGGCGVRLGYKVFYHLNNSTGVSDRERSSSSLRSRSYIDPTFDIFYRNARSSYIPRAVFVDTDPDTIQSSLMKRSQGSLFDKENIISGNCATAGNWAESFNDTNLGDSTMDAIQREAEECDSLQGFHICHSIGGGTGGGLTARLFPALKDEFPNRILNTFTTFSNSEYATFPEESLNAMLSMTDLIDCGDATFCIDNVAICNSSNQDGSNELMNVTAGDALFGVHSILRSPDIADGSLRALTSNFIPNLKLQFLSLAYRKQSTEDPSDVTASLFTDACNISSGSSLMKENMFFGQVVSDSPSNRKLQQLVSQLSKKVPTGKFISDPLRVCFTPLRQDSKVKTTYLISHSMSIKHLLKRLAKEFDLLFKRRFALHVYEKAGLDLDDFKMARAALKDVLTEYDRN